MSLPSGGTAPLWQHFGVAVSAADVLEALLYLHCEPPLPPCFQLGRVFAGCDKSRSPKSEFIYSSQGQNALGRFTWGKEFACVAPGAEGGPCGQCIWTLQDEGARSEQHHQQHGMRKGVAPALFFLVLSCSLGSCGVATAGGNWSEMW